VPGYADLDRGFTAAVLEEAGKVASDVLAPLNAVGDREGCVLENGVVRTPTGFKAAFEAMKDGGWTALDCDPEYGGQGLPYLMGTAVGEIFVSANMAFNMYQGLTHGAYSAIHARQRRTEGEISAQDGVGEWTGTMNLTEPHCGTDLGLMRTKAEPQADGSYSITGQKIFISAGEHDLAENIIHLVLAKAPGRRRGHQGHLAVHRAQGAGERRRLAWARATRFRAVGKIEDKMGIHGNATCVMNYDGATGLAARRGKQGHAGHVHHDERGAAGRRPAGLCPGRGRLPERAWPMPRTACRAAP
jgi:alkylation response protein AidB-like acyl-CoA dehydrogenase